MAEEVIGDDDDEAEVDAAESTDRSWTVVTREARKQKEIRGKRMTNKKVRSAQFIIRRDASSIVPVGSAPVDEDACMVRAGGSVRASAV